MADGLGPVRHLAVRANGDIYVSTPVDRRHAGSGIIALHLGVNHKADRIVHFSTVDGGTGIEFSKGDLYASTASAVYRFRFSGNSLLPEKDPQIVVEGLPASHPGFARAKVPLAFDGKGNLYVAIEASGNFCTDSEARPKRGSPPVELNPCPDLGERAGIRRFSAARIDQKFARGGAQIATGLRETTALAWSPDDGHLYVITEGVDETHRFWPQYVSRQAENQIADGMYRVTPGANFGWPYTYYDGVRKLRLIAPAYGGNGNETAPPGKYSTPVLTFQPRASEVDLVFYTGRQFPASYRDGAFTVQHGTFRLQNGVPRHYGFDVVFLPFNRSGVAGAPRVFATGFAEFGASSSSRGRATYRPIGAAVGPHGSLYVADSEKGRIWRIAYGSH